MKYIFWDYNFDRNIFLVEVFFEVKQNCSLLANSLMLNDPDELNLDLLYNRKNSLQI